MRAKRHQSKRRLVQVALIFALFVTFLLSIVLSRLTLSWLPVTRFTAAVRPQLGIPRQVPGKWHGHSCQDKWVVLSQCLKDSSKKHCVLSASSQNPKTKGFFVDLGARDGVSKSNTKTLERSFAWRGICIERDPIYFWLLRFYRPLCARKHVLVGQQSGEVKTFMARAPLSLGGVTSAYSIKVDRAERMSTPVSMSTFTLTDVLDEYTAPRFMDYLSLNTGQDAIHVLLGLDHSRYKFARITVEHNYDEGAQHRIHEYLTTQGYVRAEKGTRDGCEASTEPGKSIVCETDRGIMCTHTDDFYVHRCMFSAAKWPPFGFIDKCLN